MDLVQFAPFFLFLHVMGAILAFGPTFAYSIMGSMAGKEPQHANFSSRQVEAIGNKLVYPLAIFQGITGVLLLIALQIQPQTQPWLVAGIILYLVAITYALTDRAVLDAATAGHATGAAVAGGPRDGQEDPAWRDAPRRPDRHHRVPDGGQARPLIPAFQQGRRDAAVP